eukprot:NODE_2997_length_717_cov_205.959581_g2114_i0.p1 GENE.NODE_2997_length_717_cov_205.959581_g2114_i0~~NODE_2997_length_717_cov_205.959581_g2114_i0.p1  ORF type:complete len:197 (+),score=90.65 NODE_2997_length_717_cov_205.959581_g2114_i0:60-593(+)
MMQRKFVPALSKALFSRCFAVKAGDSIPSVQLDEATPATKVNIADLCKGKKVVIFGVPGAFTPGCSKTHLPGYVQDADQFKQKGVDEIICVSVNDAFVMGEWGKVHGAEGKVRMLADPRAEFTEALGLELQAQAALGGVRSKRFSMVAQDGVIKTINVEPDNTGLTCSLAAPLISQL